MTDKQKTLPEIVTEIDALFGKATKGEWERELEDTHSAEATFACVYDSNGQHLFGAENSDLIEIQHEDDGDSGTRYWDETGKRNLDLVCALKNNWPRISAALKGKA